MFLYFTRRTKVGQKENVCLTLLLRLTRKKGVGRLGSLISVNCLMDVVISDKEKKRFKNNEKITTKIF